MRIIKTLAVQPFILSSILLLVLNPIAHALSTQSLSFREAVRYALANNPRIGTTKARIEAAAAGVNQARGAALPSLNLELNAMRSNNPLTVFASKLSQGNAAFADFGADLFTGPGSIGIKPPALNSPGYYTNWNTGIVMLIPIFSGGQSIAMIKKAGFLKNAAEAGDHSARAALAFEVLKAYQGVHLTNQLVAIARSGLAAADGYVSLTKDLYKLSVVIESDVLSAENYRRSARATLQAALAEKQNQLDAFRSLIGKPNSRFVPGKMPNLLLPEKAINKLNNRVRLANPDIAALKSQIKASQQEVKAKQARYWPSLNVILKHEWNSPEFALKGSANTVLLQANWNIFSAGQEIAATQQAVAEYEMAQTELQTLNDSLNLAIRNTLQAIKVAQVKREVSRENAKQSIRIVKQMRERYGRGVITLGQLLNAQMQLDSANAQIVTEDYKILMAKAKLLMLTDELNVY